LYGSDSIAKGGAMWDERMPVIRFPLDLERFHQLPRNAAYKYEYLKGQVVLSPNPRTFHARLDLARFAPGPEELAPDDEYVIAPVNPDDRDRLTPLFAGAFGRVQPFASLTDDERREAARDALDRTFRGDEGPWVAEASAALRSRDDELVGAILVTLLPESDPVEPEAYEWREPAPADLWASGKGQPHLTWVFVHPFQKGHGIGTRLLLHVARVLRKRGDRHLLSTFIAGNDSTLLWHWRNGFELLPHVVSRRRMRHRFRQ
jgi:GNAT superfamily N-acetyltransferase